MVSASLSGISMLNSSSMAMTTSTVSKLSRPRSLAKWALDLIYSCEQTRVSFTVFGSYGSATELMRVDSECWQDLGDGEGKG